MAIYRYQQVPSAVSPAFVLLDTLASQDGRLFAVTLAQTAFVVSVSATAPASSVFRSKHGTLEPDSTLAIAFFDAVGFSSRTFDAKDWYLAAATDSGLMLFKLESGGLVLAQTVASTTNTLGLAAFFSFGTQVVITTSSDGTFASAFAFDPATSLLETTPTWSLQNAGATSAATRISVFSARKPPFQDERSALVQGCRGEGVYDEHSSICRAAIHERSISDTGGSILFAVASSSANAERCDASWTLLARQNVTLSESWVEPLSWIAGINQDDSSSGLFSVLDQLEAYRNSDETFTFKMSWPELGAQAHNIWQQTSNPVTEYGAEVKGYEPLELAYPSASFRGLRRPSPGTCRRAPHAIRCLGLTKRVALTACPVLIQCMALTASVCSTEIVYGTDGVQY